MNKHFYFTALVAVASLSLVACQQEQKDPKGESDKNELHFHIKAQQDPPTKSFLYNNGDGSYTPCWNNGDVLGAFLSGTTIDKNVHVDLTLTNTATDGPTGVFEGSAVAAGQGTFQAFYPNSAFEKGYDDGSLGFNIGVASDYIQHPEISSPDPSCDVLISKACDYISDGTDVVIDDLVFTRPLSILKVNLNGAYAKDEQVSWFKVTASSGTLSGRVKINPETKAVTGWAASKSYAWAQYSTTKPVINVANNNTVYLVVNPTTLTAGTTLTFTAETGLYQIEKSVVLSSDITFPVGDIAVINLTIEQANCTAIGTPGQYGLYDEAGAFEDGGQYVFIMPDGATPSTYYALHTYRTLEVGGLTPVNDVITNPSDKYVFIAEAGSTTGKFALKNKSTGKYYPAASGTSTDASSSKVDIQLDYLSASGAYKINLGSRFVAYFNATEARFYGGSSFEDQIAAGKALTSQKSGAFKVYKLNYTPKTPIASPTGLSVSGMTLSWNAVSGAASYTVTIGETVIPNVTDPTYTFTGFADYYNVSVVAVPADTEHYKNSVAATLSDAVFGTPTLIEPTLSDGGVTTTTVTATWADDPHATNGYHCELYVGANKMDEKNVAFGVGTVTFTGLTAGTEYTVKVNAIAITAGAKPYTASTVASINLTPAGIHIANITAAGSYAVDGVTVMAVYGQNIIVSDATGSILVYAANSLAIGDVINISGSVKSYNGVWEFYNSPSMTKTGTTTPVYPSPVAYDSEKITSYATTPVIEYATATGVVSGSTLTVATGKVLNVYGDLSAFDGRTVIVNGYAFGYKDPKVSFMLVGTPTLDPSVPYMATTPASGSTIEWDADKYGSANAETISVSLNGSASGYTVSYTDTNSEWSVSDNNSGTITVYPIAANSSSSNKTLAITITHKDDGTMTSVINLKQNKAGGVTWTRVTNTATLLSGGTFILGYEATENSGVIIPLRSDATGATTSANGVFYSGTGSGTTSNDGTIDMSTVTETSKYEVIISANSSVSGAIDIRLATGNYVGNSNGKNTGRVYAAPSANTAYKPTLKSDDKIELKCEAATSYPYFQYNTGSPRFCNYNNSQKNVVIYKKD